MSYKPFSPSRIIAIASNTLLELVRLKVFYFLLLFAFFLIGSSIFMAQLTFQEQFQVLKDVSLGSMSIFTWLLAVLTTAMLLPKDIEDRTLYSILAKPIPRSDYLLGRFFGVAAMLFIAMLLMSTVFVIALYAREQMVIQSFLQEAGNSPEAQEQANTAILEIKSHTFQTNLIPAIVLIFIKALLCAALTLMISTFSSSWIFTIFLSVAVYFVGHLQPMAREYWLDKIGPSVVAKTGLAVIALLFPDLQLFNVVDDVVAGTQVPMLLFAKTVIIGMIYVFVYLMGSYFAFSNKEL